MPAATPLSQRVLTLGYVLALYPFGQFLGSPVLGALSDRRGRRSVLLGSLVASLVWYVLIATAVATRSLVLLTVA